MEAASSGAPKLLECSSGLIRECACKAIFVSLGLKTCLGATSTAVARPVSPTPSPAARLAATATARSTHHPRRRSSVFFCCLLWWRNEGAWVPKNHEGRLGEHGL